MSGIRCGAIAYGDPRACIKMGVKVADKSQFFYRNSNFALFRVIIPRMRSMISSMLDATFAGQENFGLEDRRPDGCRLDARESARDVFTLPP